MLQLALAQVRVHARRFIAVGIAVMLGVAFLSATLMVGATTNASLGQSIGASYARADLVVTGEDTPYVPAGVVEELAAVDGVEGVHGLERGYGRISTGSTTSFAVLTGTAPDGLEPAVVTSGSYPSQPDEVALDAASAARLEVVPGDVIALDRGGMAGATGSDTVSSDLLVTGLIEPSADPRLAGGMQILAAESVIRALNGGETILQNVQLALDPAADTGAVALEISSVLAGTSTAGTADLVVRTAEEQTLADVAQLSGGDDALTLILLAFAAVAVLVAGLVISNTFSVLVAQRTRELALLRCVGADRRQIRSSVLIEAALVGLVGSVLGVLLAVGVMAGLVGLARQTEFGSFAVLAVPPAAALVGVAVGVSVTLLAALLPARAATRVAPLAALRPSDPVAVRSRSGRVRLATGLVILGAGVALLAVGALRASLVPAVAGGASSFLGVVLLAPFFVPASVAAVGRIARPLGVPGTLAAVNAVRNPARTTASSVALMVGVTLVAMVMVGGQSARSTFDAELDRNYTVDLEVAGIGASSVVMPGTTAATTSPEDTASVLLGIDGVRSVVELTPVMLARKDGGSLVYATDPAALEGVLRSEGKELTDGVVLAPEGWTDQEVVLDGGDGPSALPVVTTDAAFFVPIISRATAERLGGAPPDALATYLAGPVPEDQQPAAQTLASYVGSSFWLGLDAGMDTEAVRDVQSRIVDVTGVPEYQVSGAALERVAFNEIIDVMLLIVTGLLAVAVLIALIGVANTLSLSVLERRRENSLLRALGLTRGQLRGMLAVEAVLIAGVAALLGSVLGILYGWLGTRSALGGIADVSVSVPVGQLIAVLGVAVAAGLLASVLPARRAARLSPVAGLATE
ncbi:FtsX-like permease family protein [Arthrobacter echini]|uniref:FtsX-like permease family protein n=1 Tax=Arthrobacter echini TaxID=1529066 RepID=A0A4S5E485_9MICC|nr:FtsX-like permease family protein [Arthrobacter echini]THJ66274.1 FtsX-like permease family protein [Arthrobacter echini]